MSGAINPDEFRECVLEENIQIIILPPRYMILNEDWICGITESERLIREGDDEYEL